VGGARLSQSSFRTDSSLRSKMRLTTQKNEEAGDIKFGQTLHREKSVVVPSNADEIISQSNG
jgi:hypothetical protein